VFKEIADRLYSTYIKTNKTLIAGTNKKDSTYFKYNGYKADLAYLSEKLQLKISDSTGRADEWTSLNKNTAAAVMQKMPINKNAMPPLKGLGLKDALYLCEEMGLMVQVKGRGRVLDQSILPGQPIAKGQLIQINLN
jgi:cell division protein FtsI (penicillin-binding protein 3)